MGMQEKLNKITNLNKNYQIRQYDLLLINMGEANILHEKSGIRPCVVLSNEIINKSSSNIIVAPLTKAEHKRRADGSLKMLSTHILLNKEEYSFLPYTSLIQLEDIKSISKMRVLSYIGALSGQSIRRCKKSISFMFSLGGRNG